ncbi:uncharacterized protein LOC111699621 [Eurytemora carolleeae]|uniref:uncharacterized protein LOC111699621 n=1 Tax=Eurytemora carolleeae TaxID=1294199 RepID=UPI000C76B255|nr:uncharacterized protein LOC111699621 [Eurytemora carolleeae]|eukprot:XP_023326111.1 uncharacterized protein LOC111699621 [Eurytemora affinis]
MCFCLSIRYRELERRDIEKMETLGGKIELWLVAQPRCSILEDPPNGRFDCYMNITLGVYCEIEGNSASWNITMEDLNCIPAFHIAVIGGTLNPTETKSTMGSKILNMQNENNPVVKDINIIGSTNTFMFTKPAVQFFKGAMITMGGSLTKSGLYIYTGTILENGGSWSPSLYETPLSVVVHDRVYLIAGFCKDCIHGYMKETTGYQKYLEPRIPSIPVFSNCVMRYLDKYLLIIYGSLKSPTLYNVITGEYTSNKIPIYPDQGRLDSLYNFACTTFMDKNTGEELIIISGGYINAATPVAGGVHVFTPSLGSWKTISQFNHPRRAHNVVVTANGVFAVGGIGALPGDMSMKPIEKLNMATMKWVVVSNLQTGYDQGVLAVPGSIL